MTARSYYEVLGVPVDAPAADIKRRFRELARTVHPDIAKSPDATSRFKEINEAYRVLSDPDRRSAYDADRRLAEARAKARQDRRAAADEAHVGARRSSGRAQQPTSEPRPSPTRAASPADHLVTQASGAFRRMRFREAEDLCKQALALNRRSGAAYEILGDIRRARGQTDEAIAMYSFALQLDRSSRSLRTKFEQLAAQPSAGFAVAGGAMPSATHGRPAAALLGGLALLSIVVVAVRSAVSEPAASFFPWDWHPGFVVGLLITGLLSGVMASVAGLLSSARDELLLPSVGRSGRRVVPMGPILVLVSAVSFWVALFFYVCGSLLQEALSRSIMLGLVWTGVAVATFSVMYADADPLPLLALSGNMVFPAFVAGWALGDGLCGRR